MNSRSGPLDDDIGSVQGVGVQLAVGPKQQLSGALDHSLGLSKDDARPFAFDRLFGSDLQTEVSCGSFFARDADAVHSRLCGRERQRGIDGVQAAIGVDCFHVRRDQRSLRPPHGERCIQGVLKLRGINVQQECRSRLGREPEMICIAGGRDRTVHDHPVVADVVGLAEQNIDVLPPVGRRGQIQPPVSVQFHGGHADRGFARCPTDFAGEGPVAHSQQRNQGATPRPHQQVAGAIAVYVRRPDLDGFARQRNLRRADKRSVSVAHEQADVLVGAIAYGQVGAAVPIEIAHRQRVG